MALPTKFVYIHLTPRPNPGMKPRDVGRAMGTLFADEVFQELIYKAKTREDLLTGIDEFMEHLTVLPPCEWDSNTRIEPPVKLPPQVSFVNNSTQWEW